MAVWTVELDSPANIFLIALLMHAASRRTTNSKPSLEMRVTYLLEPCFWLELAMVGCLGGFVDGRRRDLAGDAISEAHQGV
jgi:hypothetical protein